MINEDRHQLNERFCVAFKMLEDRGLIVKNDRNGKGIGDVAERLLNNRSYGHIVRAFLSPDNERVISYTQAMTFCREYGINESWMLYGDGNPFGTDLKKYSGAQNTEQRNNILFTSVEAFAGSALSLDSFTQEKGSLFSIPGLEGSSMVAFPVSGNSMEPIILNGDMVVCREVSNIQEIRDNDIYAVKNNGTVWIKYVQRIFNPRGQVSRLKLISANHLEHDPFIEDVNQYTRRYKVVRKISEL